MFERHHEPLLPLRAFYGRLVRSAAVGVGFIAFSLLIGVIGYHVLAPMPWLDALLNASMILAGMGPVDTLHTSAAKLFASAYAIFSGVAFLSSVGLLMAPLVHRFLHRFHLDVEERASRERRS
jgi:hypothetical protein